MLFALLLGLGCAMDLCQLTAVATIHLMVSVSLTVDLDKHTTQSGSVCALGAGENQTVQVCILLLLYHIHLRVFLTRETFDIYYVYVVLILLETVLGVYGVLLSYIVDSHTFSAFLTVSDTED